MYTVYVYMQICEYKFFLNNIYMGMKRKIIHI